MFVGCLGPSTYGATATEPDPPGAGDRVSIPSAYGTAYRLQCRLTAYDYGDQWLTAHSLRIDAISAERSNITCRTPAHRTATT
jgi:hypothetical protein